MSGKHLPKKLNELKKEQLEPCPQNEILFDKLLDHIQIGVILKKELANTTSMKDTISLSNTLNGNSKSIIAIMNAFIYKEDIEENSLEQLLKSI